jgi:hypothetical protein
MKGLVGLNREDNLDQRRLPYYVHEIRLTGSYPDTKLILVISHSHHVATSNGAYGAMISVRSIPTTATEHRPNAWRATS